MPDALGQKPRLVADPDQINPAQIRLAAMNLLSRREHSMRELTVKLNRRFPDEALVAAELQRLVDENLQSDTRFAESFVRQRANRGYGPARVLADLRQRGLTETEFHNALESNDIDWCTLAAQVYLKKFGEAEPRDLHEKGKRARFMQYRGFFPEHFQHLLSQGRY